MLYLLISIAIMDVFSCSYIVLTFQVAINVCCIGERRIGRAGSRCYWLSLFGVIRSDEPLPTGQRMCVWCFCVSVTISFLLGGVVNPTLNPQTWRTSVASDLLAEPLETVGISQHF